MNNSKNTFDVNTIFAETNRLGTQTHGNDDAQSILETMESVTARPYVSNIITPDSIHFNDGKIMAGECQLTREGFDALCARTISGTKQGFMDLLNLTGSIDKSIDFLKDQVNRSLKHDLKFNKSKAVVLTRNKAGVPRIEAFHSDKYASLPNAEAFGMASRILGDTGNKVKRWSLEGRRLRTEFVSNDGVELKNSPVVGDVVQFGIDMSNSEDLSCRFRLAEYLYRVWCSNGCIRRETESLASRRHVGSKVNMLRDIDNQLENANFMAQSQSIIESMQKSIGQKWTKQATKIMKALPSMSDAEVDKWLELVEDPTIFDGHNFINEYMRIQHYSIENRQQAEVDAVDFLQRVEAVGAYA